MNKLNEVLHEQDEILLFFCTVWLILLMSFMDDHSFIHKNVDHERNLNIFRFRRLNLTSKITHLTLLVKNLCDNFFALQE